MLRECIRHEPLAKIILWSEQFYDFFRYVEMSTFDIASDAFATFKVTYKNYRLLTILATPMNRCYVFHKPSLPSLPIYCCPLVGRKKTASIQVWQKQVYNVCVIIY